MSGSSGTNGILVAAVAIVVGLLALAYLGDGSRVGEEGAPSGNPQAEGPGNPPEPGGAFLGRSDLLDGTSFDGTDVGGLSALTYDPRRDLYYALVDRQDGTPARYYSLRLPFDGARLGEPEVFDVTILRDDEGEPFGAGRLDGEGVAVSRWGDLLVASEAGPKVFRFALDGRLLGEIPVPGKFSVSPPGRGEPNYSFEGLALAPEGDTMFVAPQRALRPDRDRSEGGTNRRKIRLLRYEARGVEDPRLDGEFFYLADSAGGVADVSAVSGVDLLVLEHGNELFRVDLSGAQDVSGVERLADTTTRPLQKDFVVDLADCAPAGGPGGGEPPAYEGIAIGPELPGGGRSLLLISDDNFDERQTTSVAAIRLPSSPDVDADLACR